ncbi:hypothetical protein P168DRAFT_288652 [Aspergillus campestris IBT 28561]|uniref:Deoxyribonuclease NucA/NucB domain-containing protein n=1 Tax=Aspergillus campestris (strain IBT 28561) TaxID=1392248 RepID=A0A2I1DA49_ASPC2|nr:uncharacterized protein P168DRAFT_288652 [Aspergillus campestris IBT 28561]PKY06739.1 hypothetical protein P168DRAFT_288652 [Aspergillus campestris IBT 28561]
MAKSARSARICVMPSTASAKPKNLTWDKPNTSKQRERSSKAGCRSNNGCSKSPYGSGYQCDEFPFKSVREADRGGQLNRCVLARYNRRQGQYLRDYYNSYGEFRNKGCDKKSPCRYTIGFKNEKRLEYCKARPHCRNDGNEHTKSGPATVDGNDTGVDGPAGGYHRVASGDVIYVPGGAAVGDVVLQATFSNATVPVAEEFGEEVDDEEYVVLEDRVVEEVKGDGQGV